jgi:hypothetical protein
MSIKTRTIVVAAFVLGSASAALAQSNEQFESSQYLRNPNAPASTYQHQLAQPAPALIEGRNVAAQTWVNRSQDPFNRSINLTY